MEPISQRVAINLTRHGIRNVAGQRFLVRSLQPAIPLPEMQCAREPWLARFPTGTDLAVSNTMLILVWLPTGGVYGSPSSRCSVAGAQLTKIVLPVMDSPLASWRVSPPSPSGLITSTGQSV